MPREVSTCVSKGKARWRWLTCLGCHPQCTDAELDLLNVIFRGDSEELEQCLKHLKATGESARLTVRRNHPNSLLGTFFQECSPVIWAVDCRQWHLLPILSQYGYDMNRPQLCRRWTYFCRKQSRPNHSPYRRLWTKGQYTYQSSLDYFFASVYEKFGEYLEMPQYHDLDLLNPLHPLLSRAGELLAYGVDVHRIDSIIVFNSLAGSFDRFMCRYFDEGDDILPDIPKRLDAFIELEILQRLIENGFSEFECMEYVNPNTNWFGILICLLSHPRLIKLVEENQPVPPILRCAALLFINILMWRHFLPACGDLRDTVNNLRLRKTYIRRYGDQRTQFISRIASVVRESDQILHSPPSLGVLARNRIRGLIGGTNFKQKVETLGLPSKLAAFLSYIGVEHVGWIRAPPFVVAIATGKLNYLSFEELDSGVADDVALTRASRRPPSLPIPPRNRALLRYRPGFTARGTSPIKRRASACPRISRFQPIPVLRIQRSMTAVVRGPRPSSAPLLKLTPKATHCLQLPVW
ncbi:unnamed protein product [Mesocestoides corti]|uniref:Reverse transcriptase domain-containing protein n=1 Tax=Mesocestoides corti TaxID=53468 RepID=A0A0R3ULX6_MESCO|nr:unnamed protein product [Mesocestoides corti]